MEQGACRNPDCTIQATGKCLLSHPDPRTCPHFVIDMSGAGIVDSQTISERTEVAPSEPSDNVSVASARTFHLGHELGTTDALEIMRARYTHLIGILGSTDAGKTCLLSSLYLMACNRQLPQGYVFAGSLTLQAFEDRARGLREWEQGHLGAQLVDHTILADPRQPGLLHLAIRKDDAVRRRLDLLFTDLPGEWTDNLVLRADTAKQFRFLQRADGIILVVDGVLLMSDQRFKELQRMKQLLERLSTEVLGGNDVPLVLLISKSDEIKMQVPPVASELLEECKRLGFRTTMVSAAAISRYPKEVANGAGVFEAIEVLFNDEWPAKVGAVESVQQNAGRAFGGFRA